SWPLTRSLWICLTTRTGAAAGGGGGGGGGGGATRKVISCVLGSAFVKISGISTRTPTSNACKTNEIAVVAPRFVLSLPPDSIRLSSNIGFSVDQTLRILRHRTFPVCSQDHRFPCNAAAASKPPQRSLSNSIESAT